MKRPTIMVVGATGLLGPYLVEHAAPLGRVLTAARRDADVVVDVTDAGQVSRLLGRERPDVLIHAAAMTDVNLCEKDPAEASAVNEAGTLLVARYLPESARLVYVSTDQVYPDRPGPHAEETAEPINAYGRSKLAGEAAALKRAGALVLRTNLFGPSRTPGRTSLSDFVIGALTEKRPVVFFDDILFSPLHLDTLGALTAECISRSLSGCYNLGSRQGMSKADFALAIAALKDLPTHTAQCRASTGHLPDRAPRPKDMRLDVTRIERALGMRMPTLMEEIRKL